MSLERFYQSILLNVPSKDQSINIPCINKLTTITQSQAVDLLHKIRLKSLDNRTGLGVPLDDLTVASGRVEFLLSLVHDDLADPLRVALVEGPYGLLRLDIPFDDFSISKSRVDSFHISTDKQVLNRRARPSVELSQNLTILSRPN